MDHVNVIFERDPLALDDEFSNESTQQSEDNLYCCQVCNMILIGFHKYTPEEQAEIIRKGRPVPQLDNLVITTSTGKKSFCSKRYEYDEWLTGCKQRSKLYCWPCLLFSERIDPWTTTGISDINNLACSTKSHSTWDIHIDAMFKWKTFGKTSPNIGGDDEEFSDHEESDQILKEEEIMKNRKIIKKFVHIVCFLGVHELCLSEEERDDLKDPIDQMNEVSAKRKKDIGTQETYSSESCELIFQNVLSNIITQLNARFSDLWKTKFISLITNSENSKLNTIHLGNLYLPFKESFDMPLLVTELSVLGESKAIKKTNQKEILKTLRTMDLSSTFPQTTKLCELSTALPITEGKSTLERVENYIQTTSLKHRLSIMAVLKIEKAFILELSKNPKFYDKIIEELSDKEPFIPLIHNL
ncbi:unnamed protein product [Nezara viridula]|uniref:Zinc finger MYM-type protein 1-like n=1 Tax=Nezara viridula TaxID=85310 RepID=A0A9P0MIC0_NEZVI|nr:unnamed protein product [Nezara viridula]